MGIVGLNLFHINPINPVPINPMNPFHINIINRDHINWSVNTFTKLNTVFKSLMAVAAEKVEDIVVFESKHLSFKQTFAKFEIVLLS